MLTKEQYIQAVKGLHENWKNYEERWKYHKEAIEWLKLLKPKTILEIGGLGVKLKEDSTTLDFNERWKIDQKPNIIHDIREIPWPINKFDCIVALEVFHHTDIEKTFKEAKKKCNILILALPDKFDISKLPTPLRFKRFKNYKILQW